MIIYVIIFFKSVLIYEFFKLKNKIKTALAILIKGEDNQSGFCTF